jgi:putative spermidine/putrescine transport system ATP-binding protein
LGDTNDDIIEFISVEKTYDGRVNVVEDLNLSIRRGEFLTLLGPSGSGKTTTLMMLAGFEAATGGDIRLNGKSLNNVPPFRRNMGVVFQNYALFPHKTVLENVAFPLIQRKLPKLEIQKRAMEALQMVELEAFSGRRPQHLSGGQQQRVALARALVFEPEVVLMDEPLGALDKKLREQMQIEIKHLHDQLGLTVVYVTHDQGEALTMSDRVAVFHQGRIQQIDDAVSVYERPGNEFVANFIGENNTLRGTIEAIDGDTCRVQLAEGMVATATAANQMQIGDATTLSVRPERVLVNTTPGNGVDNLPATVSEIIYFGDHRRVMMRLKSGAELMAKVPLAEDGDRLQVGDALSVGWLPAHCRAFA